MGIYIKELRKPTDDQFDFHLSNGDILRYKKARPDADRYYLTNPYGPNQLLFDKLGFVNDEKNKFVSKIVGYDANYAWPEVKSEKDLMRVINALCAYNNPKHCLKTDFIVEDYPVLPSEVLSFYNKDKTRVTFEEFEFTYVLYPSADRVWWSNVSGGENSEIFKRLAIKNKNKWVSDIVGYTLGRGVSDTSFPEVKTKEDAYKVMDALIAEYIKQFKPKTTIKTNSYGDSKIELRRKKADVRVGSCPAGSIVYGKRSKASIRSRSISYTACPGY